MKAYTDALKLWNAKDEVNKTHPNFKIHVCTKFHALRKVGALTIQESSINMIHDITERHNQLSENLSNQLNTTIQVNFVEALNLLKG